MTQDVREKIGYTLIYNNIKNFNITLHKSVTYFSANLLSIKNYFCIKYPEMFINHTRT